MILVILTAFTAVCGAAKLDRHYLPPITAKTAGGSPGALKAPFDGPNQGLGGLPTGSYTNDAQGVVVDAVNPGTRTSGAESTGLGGPRTSYGSTDSKVGDAAFFDSGNSRGPNGLTPGFKSLIKPDEYNDDKTKANTLKFANDVGLENYSYEFQTDNGISVGENGVAANGVQAQGGYSYKGDDGKTYSVTYTADEGGYRPQGHHLPTPPPIPDEILKSLEQNAKEEAAGLVDDGSYNAQKYNDEGDYSSNGAGNNNDRPTIGGGDATASSYVSHSDQASRPSSGVLVGSYKPSSVANSQVQGAQGFGQISGDKQSGFGLNKAQSEKQEFGEASASSVGGQSGSSSNNYGSHEQFGGQPQFGDQGAQGSSFSQSTQNKFGSNVQPQAHAHGSGSSAPIRTPSFNSLAGSNVNSAYSSATSTGSGSASAFASTGSAGSGLKNDYLSPTSSNGAVDLHTQGPKSGSDSSVGASFPNYAAINPNAPSTASASASTSGTPSFDTHSQQYGGSQHASPSAVPQHSASYQPDQPHNGQSNNANSLNILSSSKQPTQFGQNSNLPSRLGETQSHTSQTTSFGSPSVKPSGSYPSGTHSQSQPQSGISATNNGYLPPVNIVESTGKPSYHSKPQSSDSFSAASTLGAQPFGQHSLGVHSSASDKPSVSGFSGFGTTSQHTGFQSQPLNSKPSQFTQNNGFPTSSGQTQFSNTNTHFSGIQPTQPSLGFGSTAQNPTNLPNTELTTPFESNDLTKPASNEVALSFGASNIPTHTSPTPTSSFSSSFQQTSQSGSPFQARPTLPTQVAPGQYKPQSSQSSFTHTGHSDTNFASSTQKPAFSQQQSIEDAYIYKQPSKPFITPSVGPTDLSSSQFSNNRQPNFPVSSLSQQGSKYSNTPTTSTTGQYQGPISSSYNGITQAATSSFPTGSPTTSTQFGLKPTSSTQFGYQTSTQFGATGNQQSSQNELSQKPIVQSQSQFSQLSTSQTSDSSQSPTQQYQGTIYDYNKPSQTLPAEHKGTSSSSGQVTSSQTDSQGKPSEILTDSRFGSQPGSSLFGSQSKLSGNANTHGTFQQTQTAPGQKPQKIQPISTITQGQSTQFAEKPFGSSQTSGSNYQQTQAGVSQFSNPQTTQGSSFTSNTYSQSQTLQSGKKPATQTGPNFQQTQLSQNPQLIHNTGSTTASQTTFAQYSSGNKQFGSTYKNPQVESQVTQKPQTHGSSFTSNTYKQSQTLAQFGNTPIGTPQTGSSFQQTQSNKKPFSTPQTGSYPQNTQFSAFGSQFGNKGNGITQTGSTFEQTLFKPTPQLPQGTGVTSTSSQASLGQYPSGNTQFSSTFKNPQFGSPSTQKPQTQGSSFTSNTYKESHQTSQFGYKPTGTTQTDSTFQQTQFNNKPQLPQGTGVTSTSSQASLGQYPSGNTQFSSTFKNPQFGSPSTQKPLTQGSSFTSNTYKESHQTSQFGYKPTGTTNTGSNFQQIQSNQKPQLPQGTGVTSTSNQASLGQYSSGNTQFSSTFKNPQFGSPSTQKPLTQGSSFTSNTYKESHQTSQFGYKPTGTTNTGSNFQQIQSNQKPQLPQGTGVTSTSNQASLGQYSSGNTQFSSTFKNPQFGSPSTQKPLTQGSSFTSNTYKESHQTSQIGYKPTGTTHTGSNFQQIQSNQKPQLPQGTGVTSTSSALASSASLGQYSSGNTQFSSTFKNPQFGSPSTQKPQTQGSSFTSNTYKESQTSQFGNKPTGTNLPFSQKQQFTQGTSFGQNPSSIPQTDSSYQPTQLSSSGLQFAQKPDTSQGSTSTLTTVSQTAQYGQKPFGNNQQTTFGSHSPFSQVGPQGKKPFSSSQTPFQTQFESQKPQTQASAFASGSDSNVAQIGSQTQKPFGSIQTGQVSQNQQTTQISGQKQGAISTSSQTQKPFGNSFSQTNQQSQYTQTATVGQNSFGVQAQKPFGSQSSSQQSQFNQAKKPYGSSQGSAFQFGQSVGQQVDQKTQPNQNSVQTTSITSQFGQSFGSAQSSDGYNYNKPQTAFNSAPQFGGQANLPEDQKTQPTQTNFNPVSTSQPQFGSQPIKLSGSSSAQNTYQQTQSSAGSPQFGSQPTKETEYNSQFGGQAFQPTSTSFTQGSSSFLTQNSAISTPQFGVQPTKPTVTQFSGQPFKPVSTQVPNFGNQALVGSTPQFGAQPTQSAIITSQKPSQIFQTQFSSESFKPSGFSSTQAPSIPSRLGSNVSVKPDGPVVSTVQSPIATIVPVPGYELDNSAQGSFIGQGEKFGGPRDPPRFDEKTGYHY